ncbi:MAG: glucose 1-dehydrogenase [Acidimicrobiales bacterium]|jgi:3-oxoacyl-[acyl-carrier protein] reductase
MSASRVAVVTGASRGLGAAIADRLASDGWAVACLATTAESATQTAERCAGEHGVKTLALGAQVEDRDQLKAALSQTESDLGPVGLMVNNAGIAHVAPFEELDPEDFRRMVDINLMGVFHGSQLAAQAMIASQTAGSIVQLGSIAGINGFPNRVGYCGTKAAVHHMTKAMAVDLARHKIRVNTVAPGYIRTDMVQDLIDAGTLDEQRLTNRIPAGDLGTPEHIASCVSWLASDEAAYVTGETIKVDGGWIAYGHI